MLDDQGLGYLSKEHISALMTENGEPFNQDELDEMLEIAIDPHTQTVPYEYYINQLMVIFHHLCGETTLQQCIITIRIAHKPNNPTFKKTYFVCRVIFISYLFYIQN